MKCEICDKEFSNYRSLNGHKRIHNSLKGRYSVSKAKVSKQTFLCLECGIEKEFSPHSSYGKFCSDKCFSDYRWKNDSIPRLFSGKASSHVLKKYIIKTFGYKCSKCGIAEWQGQKLSLHLDHIDGNSDNNLPDNGRLLCPNCHSLTDTFCGRNTKNTKRNRYLQKYKSVKKQKRS